MFLRGSRRNRKRRGAMLMLVPRTKSTREVRVRENVWKDLAQLPIGHKSEAADVLKEIFNGSIDEILQPIAGYESRGQDISFGIVLGSKIAVWIRKTRRFL